MSELDVLGTLAGTDKSSAVTFCWDYLRHYEFLFQHWRHEPINLLEIGVLGGASLQMWHQYFTQARIVGIDINPNCATLARDRIAIRIGSQEDPAFLNDVATEFPPTIVIDDGSHLTHHMITSFQTLFPRLAPGGFHVFEDMAFHFGESGRALELATLNKGLSDLPIFDYLDRFIRARAANKVLPVGVWGFDRYCAEQIDTVTVAGGMVACRKRAPRDLVGETATFERLLAERAGDRLSVAFRFAQYLSRNRLDMTRATSLIEEVVAIEPESDRALDLAATIYLTVGRLDDASAAAQSLARVRDHPDSWKRLIEVERRRERPDLERTAMQRLSLLQPHVMHQERLSLLHETCGDRDAALAAARLGRDMAPQDARMQARVATLENVR